MGLGFAFIAAVFSTASQRAGNLWETLISASVALLLAVVVGITTVPYLAKRVASTRVRNVVDYRVTRLGIVYVAVVLVLGIAALNTGNNLLYIIIAAMIGAILVSGIASATVLRGVELDVLIPGQVFAKESVTGRIVLRNQRRWIPSFSINVVPSNRGSRRKNWQWKETTFTFPPGRPPGKQWFHMPDRKLHRVALGKEARIFEGSAYFAYTARRQESKASIGLYFERRGLYQQDSFGVATSFPFGFLTKTIRIPTQCHVTVYPELKPVEEMMGLVPQIIGDFESFTRGFGGDLYRLREYVPEDSVRHIDWKATAKTGSLKIREFTREDNRCLRIIFDNPHPEALKPENYENMVSLAASLGCHFATTEADLSFLAAGFDGQTLTDFLSFLATVAPAAGKDVFKDIESSRHFNLVITCRSAVPPALQKCSHVLREG